MQTIPLTQGYFTLVDDEDYRNFAIFRWYADKKKNGIYARRRIWDQDGTSYIVSLHRLIIDAPPGKHVDHINRDTLDNRKQNLRLCSNAQNSRNRIKSKNNTSGFKGVCWNKQKKKWSAEITINYRHKSLGLYKDKEEAVRAYNKGAKKYFGEFARLNKI